MIVIGADIHKSTHALAAVSGDGGALAGELEIRADEAGHRSALRWARGLDRQRVWAIEDCRHHDSSACVRVTPFPRTRLSNPSLLALRTRGRSSAIDPLVVFTVLVSWPLR